MTPVDEVVSCLQVLSYNRNREVMQVAPVGENTGAEFAVWNVVVDRVRTIFLNSPVAQLARKA